MARIPKIDLESHFFTPEYMALLPEPHPASEVRGHRRTRPRLARAVSLPDVMLTHSHHLRNTLLDLSEARIATMDEAGIAIQFLG